jgi:hypothetical protein
VAGIVNTIVVDPIAISSHDDPSNLIYVATSLFSSNTGLTAINFCNLP